MDSSAVSPIFNIVIVGVRDIIANTYGEMSPSGLLQVSNVFDNIIEHFGGILGCSSKLHDTFDAIAKPFSQISFLLLKMY